MKAINNPDHIVQNGGFVLDQLIRRQATAAFANAHGAAGRMETQPDLARRIAIETLWLTAPL